MTFERVPLDDLEKKQRPSDGSGGSDETLALNPGVDGRRPPHRDDRGLLSRLGELLFLHAAPLVAKGSTTDLITEHDMLATAAHDESAVLIAQLRGIWADQGDRKSMWRALWSMFGMRYVAIALLALAVSTCKVLSALVLGRFIRFLQTPDAPVLDGALLGLALVACMVVFSFCESHFVFRSTRIGINARVSVLALLYEHMLKLNLASLPPAGQTLNIISNDAQRLEDAGPFLLFLVLAPLETVAVFGITWSFIGLASLAAYGTLMGLIFALSTNARFLNRLRKQIVDARDHRIKILADMLKSMELLKLYAWEQPFIAKVMAFRNTEMSKMRAWYGIKSLNSAFFWCSGSIMALAGFFTLAFAMGETFTSQLVFTSLLLFNSVRVNMGWRIPRAIELVADLRVSLGRIESFLAIPPRDLDPAAPASTPAAPVVQLRNATFAWDQSRPVLHNVGLTILPGQFTAIIGGVGSSKTSLLLAILGHLRTVSADTLTVSRSLSYAPQSAFIYSGTVRENILMGAPLDPARLKRVVAVCQLDPDVARWEGGLDTRIGERFRASGGQRARICLARALYHDAECYILDDIFGPLDVHVAKRIFDGLREFLAGKAVVLVTHQLALVRQCPNVVYMSEGRVLAAGSYDEVTRRAAIEDPAFATVLAEYAVDASGDGPRARHAGGSGEIAADDDDEDLAGEDPDAEQWKEVAAVGADTSVVTRFFRMGGTMWILVGTVLFGIATTTVQAVADYQLSKWSVTPAAQQADASSWALYLGLSLSLPVLALVTTLGFFAVILTASSTLFGRMLENVMRASQRFFSINPAGRILSRMSKDTALIDEQLTDSFAEVVRLWLFCTTIVVLVAIAVPYILIPLAPVVLTFIYLRRRYVPANRQIRRIESISRSPVYGHLVSSVEGITTVTAMRREGDYFRTFCALLDDNTRALLSFYTVERWLCLRVDMLACVIIIATTALMVSLRASLGLGLAALAQLYVLNLVDATQYAVRKTAELELMFVSVERVLQYAGDIPLERAHDTPPGGTAPPADWPSRGVVEFDRVTLTYEGSDRPALTDLAFATRAGERFALVGRSGSGKTSCINALFRTAEVDCIPESSRILIDGIDIAQLGLRDLRSRLAIIPQSVFLFAHGTIRENLDPAGKYADAELWAALELVDLGDVVKRFEHRLDDAPRFSAGEAQLLQLARVVLRRGTTKVLVLDECSANIDVAQDRVVQRTIREQFAGCTVITIAHRVETIIDSDTVLYLDQGRIVEMGAPRDLLKRRDGHFRRLAEQGLGREMLAQYVDLESEGETEKEEEGSH
ncbi:hypothetical protein H9P43_005049 [Blastocladiella emersonii ATCC 22665]|nr:hypothetical protein H9P43_005049 [Blastocladiella emersonii ATCC 22665]